jgi:hypothetical protein
MLNQGKMQKVYLCFILITENTDNHKPGAGRESLEYSSDYSGNYIDLIDFRVSLLS